MGVSLGRDLFRGAVQDLRVRPRGNVPSLDVLRSIAILLVFTAHYGGEFKGLPWVQALPMFHWGWTGVDLFFVLSGLLIGGQLWKEVQRTGGIKIGRFLLRRGLRIWPLYYAFVVFIAFEGLFGRNIRPLWADSTFLSNYFHCLVGGGWSLSTEEQFYVLAPVSIALFALWIKPKHLWVLPVAGLIGLVANRAMVVHYSSLPEAALRQKLYFPLFTHADGLGIGLLLAWLSVIYPDVIRRKGLRLGLCGVMLAVGVVLYASVPILFSFTALGLIFGAATLWGIGLEKTPKVLGWHGFYIISRLSYGMYLNQFGLLERLKELLLPLRMKGGEAAFWGLYLVCVLASVGVAFITFQLVEWPFLQIRARWLESKKEQTQLQAASQVATA